MTDLTMCVRMDCQVRDQCKRHRDSGTKASDDQVYCDYRHEIPGKNCTVFIQVNPVGEVNHD